MEKEILNGIEMQVETKFWNEVNKWCVSIILPEFEYWSECSWHKNREKAYQSVLQKTKKHIDFVREFKRESEKRTEVIVY